jgi:hypothetical protein
VRTVYHPTLPGVSHRVTDDAVEAWKSAGWRLTKPEPQPTTATPAGGDTTDKETD